MLGLSNKTFYAIAALYELDLKGSEKAESAQEAKDIYTESVQLLTLDCSSKEKAFGLLNKSTLLTQTANIGDNHTLALHMRSAIYQDFTQEQCTFLGITDGLIRVSVGLESPQCIAEDFIQASQ